MNKFTSVIKMVITVAWLLAIMVFAIVALSGCNAQVIDTTWSFDKAIINLQDGTVIEGKVDSWKDFENSDMVQVKIGNTTYLTHSANVILIHE